MQQFKAMTLMTMGFLLLASVSEGRAIRATELDSKTWTQLTQGKAQDLLVEFRQGDRLPLSLVVQGDLLESHNPSAQDILVKRNFWIQADRSKIRISLDGRDFREIPEVLTGSLTVGAGSDAPGGIANGIQVLFSNHLKERAQ